MLDTGIGGENEHGDPLPQKCSGKSSLSASGSGFAPLVAAVTFSSSAGRHLGLSRSAFGAFLLALVIYAGIAQEHACAREPEFHFGLIGDLRYFPEHWIDHIFEDVKHQSPAFVVHLGGLAGPGLACTDQVRRRRLVQIDRLSRPFAYTPGLADWADCLTTDHARGSPLTILSTLRNTFFDQQRSGWPANMDVVSQGHLDPAFASYRENWRWQISNITFLTLHVIGDNNNLGRSSEADQEFARRTSANLTWLRAAFDYAARHRSRAVVLLMQADLFREPLRSFARRRPSGYFRLRGAVNKEAQLFAKPVVIAHGELEDKLSRDGHDRLRSGPKNLITVGAFGTPRQHWIRASVIDQPTTFKLERRQLNIR